MSLILHLPLNKDLRNIGLSKINLTNNGATLSDNGVFDKCYSFNGSSYISIIKPNINETSITVCLWMFVASIPSACQYLFSLNTNSGFADNSVALAFDSGKFNFVIGGAYTDSYYSGIVANQWNHIALTYNGSVMNAYVNGQIVLTLNRTQFTRTKLTIGARYNGSGYQYFLNGRLNDVRIYDHCLTESDIQKIYEGKFSNIVLNFPLNKDFRNIGLVNAETSKLGNASIIEDQNFGGCLQAGDGTQTSNGVRCNTNLLDELSEQKFSCSVWVKPKGSHVHYNGTFFSSGDWNSKSWAFGVNSANTQVDMFGPRYNTYVSCNVPVNEWTNLISVYNNRQAKLYKNGQYVTTYTFPSSYVFSSSTNWCAVGRETYANGYFSFNGNIADLRVYNLLLTEKDIQRIYQNEEIIILPSEYEKLEYIESTGTQWIDTGLKATNEYFRVTTKIIASAYNSNMRPFGSQKNTQCTIVPWPKNSTNVYGWLAIGTDYYAQTTNSSFFNAGLNTEHYMDIIANSGHVTGNYCGYVLDSTYTGSLKNGYNNYIFASNRNGSPQVGGTQKIYWIKIYLSENQLSFNGIPAKRKSDSVIGMYDMVSKQFFTNAGTGDFNFG